MPLLVNGKTIQLSDVADVYRGFSEPTQPRMRFMGKMALALRCRCVKVATSWLWVKFRN